MTIRRWFRRATRYLAFDVDPGVPFFFVRRGYTIVFFSFFLAFHLYFSTCDIYLCVCVSVLPFGFFFSILMATVFRRRLPLTAHPQQKKREREREREREKVNLRLFFVARQGLITLICLSASSLPPTTPTTTPTTPTPTPPGPPLIAVVNLSLWRQKKI